jgi:hypothetical protein
MCQPGRSRPAGVQIPEWFDEDDARRHEQQQQPPLVLARHPQVRLPVSVSVCRSRGDGFARGRLAAEKRERMNRCKTGAWVGLFIFQSPVLERKKNAGY